MPTDPTADANPVLTRLAPVFDLLIPALYGEQRRTLAARDARVRLLLLDTIGCIITGLADPAVHGMARSLARRGDGVPLPGHGLRLEPGAAGFVMGMAACWDEACEGLPEAHGRPGLHAIVAVLPDAMHADASLGRLLWAIEAAYEIGGRAGQVCRIRPGMHVDGSWGLLASVAALAAFRHADRPDILAGALSIAACQIPFSLYAPIAQGSVARNTYVGHAAALAPLLVSAAAAGIPGVDASLDDYLGLALGRDRAPPAAGADERLIVRGYLKPFAAVRHVHYPAFAAIRLREALRGRDGDIRRIVLDTYAEAVQYCGNRAPRTPIQAQFSLSYGTAHALLRGGLGPEAYRADALNDPRIRALEAMIALNSADRADGRRYARLSLVLADGTTVTDEADDVPGDPERPLSAADTVAKFVRFTQDTIGAEAARHFAARLLDAAPEEACRAVLAPLVTPHGATSPCPDP